MMARSLLACTWGAFAAALMGAGGSIIGCGESAGGAEGPGGADTEIADLSPSSPIASPDAAEPDGMDATGTLDGTLGEGADASAAAASLGAPCEVDGDCASGYCAGTPAGPLCTELCSGECPAGFVCELVVADGGGFLQLCLPAFSRLCRPCTANSECVLPGLGQGHRCVDFGEAGAFCGGDCGEVECPVGFACEERQDVQGEASLQCVAIAGQCTCSPEAVADGASTGCYRQNDAGRCEGVRECTEEGLTPCNAPSPTAEKCNGEDDDCDGLADEGLVGASCVEENAAGACAGTTVCNGGQWHCDAPEPAPEVCNGQDDDCDGEVDEVGTSGCTPRYADADEDGWGAGVSRCLCAATGVYTALVGGDCNDGDLSAHPGATERCNGVDDNCAGGVDEAGASGCALLRLDVDGDGFGALGVEVCLCTPVGSYAAVPGGDCNDGSAAVYPGATEACNGKDDDCDGVADPPGASGCTPWHRDADGDAFGVTGDILCACAPVPPYSALVGGDCDDGKAAAKPGQLEVCNGGDDDCDGTVDPPGAVGCTPWLRDEDGDGFGVTGDAVCLCAAAAPYSASIADDCNDGDPATVPGQLEACNGKDDDCDGLTDEVSALGCSLHYEDGDGDGIGSLTSSACTCGPAAPYVASVAGDCNDADSAVVPGATEACNGKDDDCDVAVDEVGAVGCALLFEDGDGDGWGTDATLCACGPSGDFTAPWAGDCDDDDSQAAPDRPEQCNGADDDCDGAIDEQDAVGCSVYFADADGDGFGDPIESACLCVPTATHGVKLGGDCDDANALRAPNQPEACDGIDGNCDGTVDEGCGIPVLGWPTAGADVRRSGQAFFEQGPAAGKLKWSVSLGGLVLGSPVILPNQVVYAATTSSLARVGVGGGLEWQVLLPAAAVGQAGPTARLGGTVVVGATNQVLHLAPDGTLLWSLPMVGAPIEASPIVDAVGNIYVLSRGGVARFDASGAQVWAAVLPDGVTSIGHPAINTNGAIVFATASGGLRAHDPDTGAMAWSYSSAAAAGTGALALGATGIAYFGTSAGVSAASLVGAPLYTWNVSPAPAGLGVFNTAYLCCVPSDQVMVSTPQATGLFKRSANLASGVYQKAPGSPWPSATDYDGDTWVTSTGGALVRLDVAGAQKWSYQPPGATIATPPAVGSGLVVVGDSTGVLHALGD